VAINHHGPKYDSLLCFKGDTVTQGKLGMPRRQGLTVPGGLGDTFEALIV